MKNLLLKLQKSARDILSIRFYENTVHADIGYLKHNITVRTINQQPTRYSATIYGSVEFLQYLCIVLIEHDDHPQIDGSRAVLFDVTDECVLFLFEAIEAIELGESK